MDFSSPNLAFSLCPAVSVAMAQQSERHKAYLLAKNNYYANKHAAPQDLAFLKAEMESAQFFYLCSLLVVKQIQFRIAEPFLSDSDLRDYFRRQVDFFKDVITKMEPVYEAAMDTLRACPLMPSLDIQ